MITATKIQTASAPTGDLPDMPIEPAWIEQGNPLARGAILTQAEDKKTSSGLWSCEPGKFAWTFTWDEFIYVLEGEVTISEDDADHTVTLRAGEMAHFPLGTRTHWHIIKPTRKFFVIRTPQPLDIPS